MHRLIQKGTTVRVVILGEGITSRGATQDSERWAAELATHRNDIQQAADCIGYESIGIYNFPDNRFDTVALLDIIKVVEREKRMFNPAVIFTHHGGDVNIDHQRTFEAVTTACRPMKDENVRTIITFETPSGTEWRSPTDPRHFLPNLFFAVGESDIEAKIAGMECYTYERRSFPHPRSPQALRIQAQRWGVTIGVPLAEAFVLVRSIN